MPSSRKPRKSAARDAHPSLAPYRQKERGERLQKVLADAGVAARRECERLIVEGAVTVNGKTIDTLPAWADPEVDRIEVYGKPLRPAEKHVYVMLFKPRGTVCTNSDPEGRPRAIDLVNHPSRARMYCVGRLDLDASGLLLLTNDGELANRLTHPRYEVPKGYDVTLDGRLDAAAIAEIERKVFAGGRGSGGKDAGAADPRGSLQLVSVDATKSMVHLELCEHRNLQLRDLMLSLGHPVKKLRRTSFGPLKLKGLAVGEWRELTGREVEMLRKASEPGAAARRAAKTKHGQAMRGPKHGQAMRGPKHGQAKHGPKHGQAIRTEAPTLDRTAAARARQKTPTDRKRNATGAVHGQASQRAHGKASPRSGPRGRKQAEADEQRTARGAVTRRNGSAATRKRAR